MLFGVAEEGGDTQTATAAAKPSTPANEITSGSAASDINNMIYEAIMEHRQREMQTQKEVLRDNQSITETMVRYNSMISALSNFCKWLGSIFMPIRSSRKRREADENKSVVTACHMYANNAQYVAINSGDDSRIELGACMHPLNPDECDVYTSLVDFAENSTIRPAMNHHITESGEIEVLNVIV